MSHRIRVFVQTALVCLSALPFIAVAPGVIDAHRAHQRETAAVLPTAGATSLFSLQPSPLDLPFLPAFPTTTPHH